MKPWISRLKVTDAGGDVLHHLLDRLRLHPVAEEGRLEPRCRFGRVDAGREVEVEDRRIGAAGEGRVERPLRGRDPRHLERGRVGEDPDHRQLDGLPGLRVADLDRDRLERALVEVEAAQAEVGGHGEVEVVAPRDDVAVDDGEVRAATRSRPRRRARSRSPRRPCPGRRSCARGRRRRARVRRTARAGVRCPSASPRSAGTTGTPRPRCPRPAAPGRSATARRVGDGRRPARARPDVEAAAERLLVAGWRS